MAFCPFCGEKDFIKIKEWKYNSFHVEYLQCKSCTETYNAYYNEEDFSHTIPKPGAKKRNKKSEKVNYLEVFFNREFLTIEKKIKIKSDIKKKTIEIFSNERFRKKGLPYKELFYSSLFMAYRVLERPILLGDIEKISDIDSKTLAKFYRKLITELNVSPPPQDPIQLFIMKSVHFDLDQKYIKEGVKIFEIIDNLRNMTGKSPSLLAASVSYYISKKYDLRLTQKEISEKYYVSDVGIRNKLAKWEPILSNKENKKNDL